MTRAVRASAALWGLLAVIVFNVTFDWNTRMASHAFIASQFERQARGLPVRSLNDGFRPMIREAALRASVWLVAIGAAGAAATTLAARRNR